MFRCKVNWAAYAEKSSAYFFALEKRKASARVIPALFLNNIRDTGELSNSTEGMLSECTAFYEKLYKRVPRKGLKIQSFLDSLEKVSELQREECEKHVTAAELTEALGTMKLNTAPGPCGWTVEFFRHFWDIFCPLLLQVVNEIYENGVLPNSMHSSIITLIPKKGKDKRYIENLRPISLLSVPYKVIAKVMAIRLKNIVGELIHTDQKGFLKGRYIGENIRLIIDLMEYADNKRIEGLLMQCDFLKAYDSISWEYVNEVIKAYGFGPKFQRWISVLYPSGAHSARINVNNFLSPEFRIERGIRQGCPLSCIIWLLCIEPLLDRIRENKDIRGIKVSDSEIKLTAYADDLTVILDGSESSLRNVLTDFDEFSAGSGLRLNVDKTICAWIGLSRRRGPICSELNLKWLEDGEPLELLGVKIFNDAKRTHDVNYGSKIDEIEKAMSPWTQRSLTPLGRVLLVKSLLLSKFVHLFAVIENPEKSIMTKLESLLFKFIWGKKDKIKRGFAKKQFLEGGIGAPDIESFANALKVGWIKRWLDPHHSSWKVFVNKQFHVTDRINIFQCATGDPQIRTRHLPKFWEQTLKAWNKIQENSGEIDGFLREPLLLNRNLNIEASLSAGQLRTMNSQNITYVRDLYNFSLGRWYRASELKQKWIHLDSMACNCLVSKIPTPWRSFQKRIDPSLRLPATVTELMSVENVTKWAYRALLAPKLIDKCSCETKWAVDIGTIPNWEKLTHYLTMSTKNIQLRWFQYRLWHRILPTRKMLKMFKIVDDDKCVFCQQAVETALHLIIHCSIVKAFWQQIWGAFKRSNAGYQTMDLTSSQIMFGIHTGGHYGLNLFLLLAKWFIWKQSKGERNLSIHEFLNYLSSFRRVQSCVYNMNGHLEEFRKLWCAIGKMTDALV